MKDACTPPPLPKKFQTGNVIFLSIGHFFYDTYQAFLPAFLPGVMENLSLSKLQGGSLSAFNHFPSLIQPIIGYISDRRNLRWIVILAPAVGAVTMSLVGVVPNYWTIVFLMIAAGLINAGLHAVGPAITGRLSGNKIGRGMGFWMVAGEAGRAVGPLAVVTAIKIFGLNGTPFLMVFGIAASVVLFFRLRKIPNQSIPVADLSNWKPVLKRIALFVIVISIIYLCAAFVISGIWTFLPTYLTEEGSTLWFAGAALTIMQVAGVVGAMAGGTWSDRIGRKPILIGAFILSPVFLVLFLYTSGALQVLFLILMGFTTLSIQPVLMAWIQQSFPQDRALSNGIYMAITFIIKSLIVMLIGWVGDKIGLRNAYLMCAGMMLVGLPLIILTPSNPNSKTAAQ